MEEIIKSLFENMALLLALSVVYVLIPTKCLASDCKMTPRHLFTLILTGIVIGALGIVVMFEPIELMEGLLFDVRSIIISTSGLLFGAVPTVIAALMTGSFRMLQGGVGMIPGTLQVFLTAALGITWRKLRLKSLIKSKKTRWAELYIFGVLAHILVIATMFLLPHEAAYSAIENVSIPILLGFPIGSVLLGLIILSQIDSYNTRLKLEDSEGRLKTMLMSVCDGVIATDIHGNVTLINKVAEDMISLEGKKIIGKPLGHFLNIINEKSQRKLSNPIQKVLDTGSEFGLTKNATILREDGSTVPVADSASPIINARGEMTGAILVMRDATEERKHLDRINYLAFHDVLTGLYNRRFFDEETKRLDVERNLPLSIIVGDVNGLKLTNDAFGHDVGDKLLREMARALKNACRKDDIVARWGGDEIIVLLPKTDLKSAENVCHRIQSSCAKVRVSDIKFSISLGFDTKNKADKSIAEVIKSAEDHMYRRKSTEKHSIRGNTIQTILSTLHIKHKIEQTHSNRVSELSKKIGMAMDLSEKEIAELELAGLMHDIGKIAISEDILSKQGGLSDDEWAEIKRHPEIGYRILSASNNMSYIAQYVLSHHERPDGKGYPFGLSREQIPIQSLIIAVADTYDAMTSDRSYRRPVSKQEAIDELKKCSGTQLDENVVKVFVEGVLKGKF